MLGVLIRLAWSVVVFRFLSFLVFVLEGVWFVWMVLDFG